MSTRSFADPSKNQVSVSVATLILACFQTPEIRSPPSKSGRGVGLGVGVKVGVGVCVGVGVAVTVGVCVAVAVKVAVGINVPVAVGVRVEIMVGVVVTVGVGLGVAVKVGVIVGVCVGVGVGVGIKSPETANWYVPSDPRVCTLIVYLPVDCNSQFVMPALNPIPKSSFDASNPCGPYNSM